MPKIYRFISDPGHGWLEVPMTDVQKSGITPTRYSFISPDGTTAYLEEDQDAGAFRDVAPDFGITEVVLTHDAPCRGYRRFPGAKS